MGIILVPHPDLLMVMYWFGEVAGNTLTPCPSRDPKCLSDRLDSPGADIEEYTPFSWESARDCGFISSREEYIRILRSLCIFRAERDLALISCHPGQEIIQMVRMLDQVDEAVNLLTEKALEWHAARDPTFSRKYRQVRGRRAREILSGSENQMMQAIVLELKNLSGLRETLSKEITILASDTMPNSSTLVGGVVAARLLSAAGGLSRLATLPAGAIQVLGAGQALFSHLNLGTPAPKHGIIYQHQRVHSAAKERRGKVSRTLAAKLAIAVKIDYYRGQKDPEFLESADRAIRNAGGRP
ncbi:MAG: putative NOP5 family protein [Methanoregulaceae archaeon PtaB.Bin108]|nr:MAG: putative NOP5 family protein [Methanoregulaceae archaeon PtaB.Bin108]